MTHFWNWFTKITGWPVQKLCFRTKIYYEDRSVQGRRIKGPAILVSNHTSLYDYAVFLFVFFGRTLRYQMAEVLFQKKLLGLFLRALGGIYVDRDTHDLGCIYRSEAILRRGGVVGIFPEGRLPREGESRPLPFQAGAAYLALQSGVPVIPIYTNGSYFRKKRAAVIIGKPMLAADLVDPALPEREAVAACSRALREQIISLGEQLSAHEQTRS